MTGIDLKAIAIFFIPSLLVGSLLGTYPGYKIYEYTWKDARFCNTCHVHDYATIGWEKSVHGQMTTCHDCHHQPLRAYITESIIMATNPPKFPKDLHHTPYVPKDLCGACHLQKSHDRSTITGPMTERDIEKIPKVDLSVLHKVHLEGKTAFTLLNYRELSESERSETPEMDIELPREKGDSRPIVCADCHGSPTNRSHNFSAVDMSCVRCHDRPHKSKIMQANGCRTCHFQDFLAPIPGLETPPAESLETTAEH